MKTLLLNPPSDFKGKIVSREQCGMGLVEEHFLPSEIFLTAAYLQERGYDVEAVDLGDNSMDFSPYQVAVAWVSVLHTFHEDISWLRQSKESGCSTVMILNEPYGEFEADTLRRYPFIDAAVRLWEREISLEELLKSWEKGKHPDFPGLIFRDNGRLVNTGLHTPRGDLSHLKNCKQLLRRQPLNKYEAVGITPGRGCTASCGFCLYADTAQRKRPLDDVITEIETVADQVKQVFLLDPDLPSTRSWTEAFCRELIKRNLKIGWRADLRPEDAEPQLLKLFRESGCEQVMVAVETLDRDIREKVGAGQTPDVLGEALHNIRHAGIEPIVFFYIGLPWDSPQSLERIARFLRAEPIARFYLKQVRPWPGTDIHEAFASLGLLSKELSPEDFVDSDSPLCPTRYLTIDQLTVWKKRIGRAGILQPGYLWRFLRERRLKARHLVQFAALLLGYNIFEGKRVNKRKNSRVCHRILGTRHSRSS
jgi:radical SAM superfamily enzyme YgiQ (UPF0313 family)